MSSGPDSKRKLVEIQKPLHSKSTMFQMLATDNWSHFGDHEREDVKKKLKEQPRNNPVDPVKMKTGAGGQ